VAGDISGVTAGTGLTGGGSSGAVTLSVDTEFVATTSNTMTLTNKTLSASNNTLTGVVNNTLTTTTGDMIYASSANTPARLPIGSADQILKVSGGIPSWATASSGGMTLINSGGTALTGVEQTISSIPGSYQHLYIFGQGVQASTDGDINFRINGDTGNNYTYRVTSNYSSGSLSYFEVTGHSMGPFGQSGVGSGYNAIGRFIIHIPRYADTSYKMFTGDSIMPKSSGTGWWNFVNSWNNTAPITSFTVRLSSGTFTSGTIYVYGVS
jgi:hypothetical protein